MNKGDKDICVAQSLDYLASIFIFKNDLIKAIPCFEESLRIKVSKLGENHVDVQVAMKNLEECKVKVPSKIRR